MSIAEIVYQPDGSFTAQATINGVVYDLVGTPSNRPARIDTGGATLYYAGAWKDAGHYVWERDGNDIRRIHSYSEQMTTRLFGYGQSFADFIPGYLDGNRSRPEEGVAGYYQLNGWTIVAFATYCFDHRSGSYTMFFIQGSYTYPEMMQLAEQELPMVMDELRRHDVKIVWR